MLSIVGYVHLLECRDFNDQIGRVAAELGLTTHGRIGLKGLTGEVDGEPLEVSFGGARNDRNMTIQMEPFGLPPEVRLDTTGTNPPAVKGFGDAPVDEKFRKVFSVRSMTGDVREAFLDHEPALETLLSMYKAHDFLQFEYGEIEVRIDNVADADDIRRNLERAVAFAHQLERDFEERPLLIGDQRKARS